jgi:hypothetical protein
MSEYNINKYQKSGIRNNIDVIQPLPNITQNENKAKSILRVSLLNTLANNYPL